MNKHNEHVSLLTALQKEGLAEGQRRRREVLWGGSPWQNAGLMNKNRTGGHTG
jgi:hypothetical protein